MSTRIRFTIGISIIITTVAFLIFTAVDQTRMYMVTVSEYLEADQAFADSTVRVAGRVAPGSIEWDQQKLRLNFTLDDMEQDQSIEVSYEGILPDMFAEERDVVVEGPYAGAQAFEADTIITSCPSKYEPEQTGHE